ncbi:hypothetical protein D3C87_2007480 [compost metagenome]
MLTVMYICLEVLALEDLFEDLFLDLPLARMVKACLDIFSRSSSRWGMTSFRFLPGKRMVNSSPP